LIGGGGKIHRGDSRRGETTRKIKKEEGMTRLEEQNRRGTNEKMDLTTSKTIDNDFGTTTWKGALDSLQALCTRKIGTGFTENLGGGGGGGVGGVVLGGGVSAAKQTKCVSA